MCVAVAKQIRRNRVSVRLVVDQNAAEGVAGIRVGVSIEDGAEVGLSFAHVRGRFNASKAASTDA